MIEIKKEKKIFDTVKFYFDMRMLKILLLGAISGFPWVIIGSSLSLWLKEEGLSRSTIGWAGLIFAVYAFNYFWAPLIDRIQIPFLTKKIGHRKSWIFFNANNNFNWANILELYKSSTKFKSSYRCRINNCIGLSHTGYNCGCFEN